MSFELAHHVWIHITDFLKPLTKAAVVVLPANFAWYFGSRNLRAASNM